MSPILHLETPSAPATASCGCGGHDEDIPVLDVRAIPHAVRHAAVFGAFDAIRPGGSIVIVAPHAPVPLLTQLAARAPIIAEYLVEGPTEWHVQITRLPEDALSPGHGRAPSA